MASTSMLMKSDVYPPLQEYQADRPVSSPADVIWSSLLNDKAALKLFIETNQARLTEAHAFIRKWFTDRGVHVAKSNASATVSWCANAT